MDPADLPEESPCSSPAVESAREEEGLSAVDRARLEIESVQFADVRVKDQRIREVLDESPVRYYQRLNRLLDSATAEAEYPALVHRLRRLRDRRQAVRRVGSQANRV